MAFLNSMSAPYLEYYLGDIIASPVDHVAAGDYSEKLLYIPPPFLVNNCQRRSMDEEVAISEKTIRESTWRRSDLSLPTHSPVVANFNQMFKVDEETFAVWTDVLRSAPEATLWIQRWDERSALGFERQWNATGLELGRLVMTSPPPVVFPKAWNEHAVLADIFMDTFVYGAVTTLPDVLWLGVPVFSIPGDRTCARVAASFLAALGTMQLTARNHRDYIALVSAVLRRPRALAKAQVAVRRRRAAKARLFDTAAWVQSAERAFRLSLEVYTAIGSPRHIIVAEL
mmetsp:Transcript_54783/g.129466  ORF Transcript_54783/g.129466 Transcript_54783/m.129466 type:complete len:285 (+) Transcript_54783:1-855(+)